MSWLHHIFLCNQKVEKHAVQKFLLDELQRWTSGIEYINISSSEDWKPKIVLCSASFLHLLPSDDGNQANANQHEDHWPTTSYRYPPGTCSWITLKWERDAIGSDMGQSGTNVLGQFHWSWYYSMEISWIFWIFFQFRVPVSEWSFVKQGFQEVNKGFFIPNPPIRLLDELLPNFVTPLKRLPEAKAMDAMDAVLLLLNWLMFPWGFPAICCNHQSW